jgi:hypothetical protein
LKKLSPKCIKKIYHRFNGLINNHKSSEEVFSKIYKTNKWGGKNGYDSGAGTSDHAIADKYVKTVMQYLDLNELSGLRMVDLGCGDYRVGRHFAYKASAYLGCDVVPLLINHLNDIFSDEKIHFKYLDMVNDDLPWPDSKKQDTR